MSEHSPAPVPVRGVYGFILYLTCTAATLIYAIWGFVPDGILHSIGITYYPQKYWAIALPVYVLMGLALFAFFIYPALNQIMAPPLDSTNTFTDEHAIKQAIRGIQEKDDLNEQGILPAYDLSISEVSKKLYG